MESYYPEEVSRRSRFARQAGVPLSFDSKGTGVSLECGVSVRMFLSFSDVEISEARFVSNGCGWAVAAADVIAECVSGAALKDLHALEGLERRVLSELGEVPAGRRQCIRIGLEALRKALADRRASIAEEWSGEKALICTCFGISEETIEDLSAAGTAATVEDVGRLCGAGTGCGSCQMLIREIVES